ncbi:hypothetical protein F5X96DRAFT_298661 [Biscogniauxia mediterranea]|nr:hypothetical protein F5X96DRAFT_298661 [Biscogniauxia mediterranea]
MRDLLETLSHLACLPAYLLTYLPTYFKSTPLPPFLFSPFPSYFTLRAFFFFFFFSFPFSSSHIMPYTSRPSALAHCYLSLCCHKSRPPPSKDRGRRER